MVGIDLSQRWVFGAFIDPVLTARLERAALGQADQIGREAADGLEVLLLVAGGVYTG